VEPWLDRATGEPAVDEDGKPVLSPKERAVQTTYAPVHALVRGLAADQAFLDAIERVRIGSESADRVARRYVWREGRPRALMRRVIERAADSEVADPQLRVLGVGAVAVWPSAPLRDGDPTEWTHAKRLPRAAAMLARLGAGRCIICGTPLATDGRRRYCGVHQQAAGIRERADREAILALLNSAADALLAQ
jgi:hypothetical protein